jgi:hypothetical protein
MATDSLVFVTTICSIYVLAFVLICVHSGLVCCVRTGCILNLNFLEERVGEENETYIQMYIGIYD